MAVMIQRLENDQTDPAVAQMLFIFPDADRVAPGTLAQWCADREAELRAPGPLAPRLREAKRVPWLQAPHGSVYTMLPIPQPLLDDDPVIESALIYEEVVEAACFHVKQHLNLPDEHGHG